jgi:hypothetical protein
MTLLPFYLDVQYVLQYLGDRDSVSKGKKVSKFNYRSIRKIVFFPLAVSIVQNRYNM